MVYLSDSQSSVRRTIVWNARFAFMAAVATYASFMTMCEPVSAETSAVENRTAQVDGRAWLDRELPIDGRVRLLLAKMTLEEKIGQMWQLCGLGPDATITGDGRAARNSLVTDIREGRVGSVLNETDTRTINTLQKVAVEESRLGIPLIIGRDVIHGFRTVMPIPLGQAASWNPALVEEGASVAAREARSVGIAWTFAPMVDIARDPRWGRIAESLGEDPHLASQLSAAMVHGFQGKDLNSRDRVAACAKHFACYGAVEGGRDYNSAVVAPSSLRNVYLPPFRAAVDAGVATLMTSFNDLNGTPGTGNSHLLREVLRDDWKFRGFVVSDWESVREMIVHGYCRDDKDAVRTAVRAGVNMEMVSPLYHNELPALVKSGEIPQPMIDELVTEVLRVKMELGLFERPYTEEKRADLLSPASLKTARKLATQSVTLLKNTDSILPFDRSKWKKIAVIGPLADNKEAQLGAWALDGRASDCQSPLASLKESAEADVHVTYAPGLTDCLDVKTAGFEEAKSVAGDADVVVIFVGESADLSGEAHSRAIIDLPGAQNELIGAIAATGKPIVLVIEAGRPLTIGWQIEKAAAVLYSFHAGTMAGPAIADLLFGVESPSAKLPVTFPKSVGQIPLYYDHMNTGRPAREYDFAKDGRVDDTIKRTLGNNSNYMDMSPYPLFPFGYGLSYATFKYGIPELSSNTLRGAEKILIRASITNTSKVAADEIAQLYVHSLTNKPVRPVRELKGFRRVHLGAGETAEAAFSLSAEDLFYFDNQEQAHLEPGKFEVFVGPNSLAPLAGQFEVMK
jgi:beta-glucosidase